MARRNQFKMSVEERSRRTFSDSFKRQKIHEIETGQTKVSEICRLYEVSNVAVYKWLSKYGTMRKKKERLIVESESDAVQLLEMRKKIAELEQLVGQKQVLLEFQDKMIEMAEEHYQIDIKKKFSGKQSSSFGTTERT